MTVVVKQQYEATMRRLTHVSTHITAVVGLLGILAAPAAAQSSDEVRYYHSDAVGTVRVITDDTGAVQARYDYQPFGKRWPSSDPADPRMFAGKERDPDTGLDYFGARYYAGETGRFTSVDPFLDHEQALVNPQLWNRYAYTLNNPLKFVDPDGRNPFLAWVAVNAAVGAATNVALNAAANYANGRPLLDNAWEEAGKGAAMGLAISGASRLVAAGAEWAIASRAARAAADAGALVPNLGSKLEYILGNASGAAHNIERSRAMLRQLESIGLRDNPETRAYLSDHLAKAFGTEGAKQANGRIARESLLMGPRGALKLRSIWEQEKLITVELYGGLR